MKTCAMKVYKPQSGIVLMSALVILLTITLIALALIRLSVVELKVAGASQRYQVLFNDAEYMVSLYFFSNQTNLIDGCLSNDFSGQLPTVASQDQCRFLEGVTNSASAMVLEGNNSILRIPNILTDYSRVLLSVEQLGCVDNYFSQVNSGQGNDKTAPAAVFFDVEARAWDQLDSDASVTIHTGLQAQMPPGAPCLAQGSG